MQSLFVLVLIAVAVLYIGLRVTRTVRSANRSDGCGADCGCSASTSGPASSLGSRRT